MNKSQAVFIGASAGGVTAIMKLLELLPQEYPLPIVVTQHLPKDSQLSIASIFDSKRKGRVLEATDKQPIEANYVYFAPPDYHLLIENTFSFSLSQDELVNFSRPSIDVMFESAALAFGSGACGVLLTGGNDDGAKGLAEIRRSGGVSIVQDPKDAECRIMPQSALDLFKPKFVGNLEQIAKKLVEIAEVKDEKN